MPRDAAKRMKPTTLWAAVYKFDRNLIPDPEGPCLFWTQKAARKFFSRDCIARVEIREIPPKPRKRNAP